MKMGLRQKPRVLFVDPAGLLWGSEWCLLLILERLDKERFDYAVCLPRNVPLVAELGNRRVRCFPWFQARLHQRGILPRVFATFGLFGAALAYRPQILHLNQAGAVRIVALVARVLRRPLVIHVRLATDAPLVARRVKCWRGVRCLAISNFVEEELCRAGVPVDRITKITDPIELTPTTANSTGAVKQRWQLGFVGRLSRDKGIDQFVRGCQRIIHARPETCAVVVGSSGGKTPDGQDYLEAMKSLAAELGIGEKVEFLGFRKDVPELMQQMEIFVMASNAEPWGRVVAEAMVAGTAVVATNAGGPAEMITDGVNGLLVPPGDVEAMTQAILRLLDDRQMATQLAAAGRDWVARECDPAKHAAQVMQVYESLLNEKG